MKEKTKKLNRPRRGLCLLFAALLAASNVLGGLLVSAEETVTVEGNTATLSDFGLEATVDLATGRVTGISRGGTPVYTEINDEQNVFYGGVGDYTASEDTNAATGHRVEGGRLIVTATNPAFEEAGVTLEYTYWLDEYRLCKQTKLINNSDRVWFAASRTRVKLDETFRSDGYYYMPWPSGRPQVKATGVVSDYQLPSAVYGPHSSCMTGLYNPAVSLTAVSTLMAQEGQFGGISYTQRHNLEYSEHWRQEQPILTADGWVHRVNRCDLQPGGTFDYQVDYFITPGDTSEFYGVYLNTPLLQEATKNNKAETPQWVRDIKYTQYILTGYQFLNTERANNQDFYKVMEEMANKFLPEGYTLSLANFYAWQGGEHPSNAETDYMKAGTQWVRENHPNIKVGQFDVAALVPNYSGRVPELYQQHPDWGIWYDENKDKVSQWYHPEGEFYPLGRYNFQFALPEVVDYLQSCIDDLVEDTAPDFIYLESSESAFAHWFDYNNNVVFTAAQNRDILQNYRDTLHESGAMFWLNDPDTLIADMVQVELASGVWEPGRMVWNNWRTVSDSLYTAKIRQENYAGGAVNLIYPYEYDRYFSYCLAYNALPNFSPDGTSTMTRLIEPLVPYFDARYEIRNGTLMDGSADIRPWWRDDSQIKIDVAGLSMGETAAVLTAINNDSKALDSEVSALGSALHVDTTRPYFLWKLAMTNPGPPSNKFSQETSVRDFEPRESDDAPAVVTEGLSVVIGSTDERVGAELHLEPFMAKMLTASNVPGYVHEVDGYSVQYKLPEVLDVALTLDGDMNSDGSYTLNAVSDRESAVAGVYLHNEGMTVKVDGQEAAYETTQQGGQPFALVTLGKGSHTIEVTGGTPRADAPAGEIQQPGGSSDSKGLSTPLILALTALGSLVVFGGLMFGVLVKTGVINLKKKK